MTPATTASAGGHRQADGRTRARWRATVATHGGSTFQTNMFSTVNMAFEVAVMRLVSVPGSRSAK